MADTPCDIRVQATGVVAEMTCCPNCRTLHLNMHAMTLRFRAGALCDLAVTLPDALIKYEHLQRRREPNRPVLQDGTGLH